MTSGTHETAKALGDVLSVSVVVGALMEWLPPLAAALTIIWTAIRIYETETVRRFLRRRR